MPDQISQTPRRNTVQEKVLRLEGEIRDALECAETVDGFREKYYEICKEHGVSADTPNIDFNYGIGRVSQGMVQFFDEGGKLQIELITALGLPF